jgi:hypothetical protein
LASSAVATTTYAFDAVLAAVGVRGRARSERHALVSALPALALVAAAALAGYLLNSRPGSFEGSPSTFTSESPCGASWAALVLSTALVSRTRWNGVVGIVLGFLVAALGLIAFTMRID